MNNRLMHLSRQTHLVYIVAAFFSIAFSIWIPMRETVINPDGICYLMSAQEMGVGGLKSAMHLCAQANWPFYSALIYAFAKLTHASYPFSAYFIDGAFTLVSVLMFLGIISELGGSRRVLWFAALIILLAHDFNAVRQYIVRDHGFWAFYLTSIFFMLRHFREQTWSSAIAWSVSILLATCFRIEGAVFLLALPFLSWFSTRHTLGQRARSFLQLNTISLLISLCACAWLLTHTQQTMDQLGRVPELWVQAKRGFSNIAWRMQVTHDGLLHYVLDQNSKSEVNLFLGLIVFFGYTVNLLSSLSLVFALLLVYALLSRAALWTRASTLVVVGYLLVNLAITSIFYAQHLFFSKRYLVAFSLILMLWVPYGLDKLLRKSNRRYYKTAFNTAMIWIFLVSLGGIFEFGYSKSYIHKAGDWIADNVPPTAALYANNYQLMYYSRHFNSDLFSKVPVYRNIETIANNQWKQYDYIALLLDAKEDDKTAAILQQIALKPARVFSNKRGDRVAIYQVRHEEKVS